MRSRRRLLQPLVPCDVNQVAAGRNRLQASQSGREKPVVTRTATANDPTLVGRCLCIRPCDPASRPYPSVSSKSSKARCKVSTRDGCRDGEAGDSCWQCSARHAQIPRTPFAVSRPEAVVQTAPPPRPLPVSTNASSAPLTLHLLPSSNRLVSSCSPQRTYRPGILGRG
ncbi:hypothetical protein BJY59DRAFT_491705 [Rhodotorula toruloides]